MEAIIDVRGLRKRYGGTLAVDDLSFTAHPGGITGLVGPSGAGKSATLRMILGLDAPDAGTAAVGGRPYRSLRTPLRQVGALLDGAGFHPERRARDHLRWMAHAAGVPVSRVDEVLEQVGLTALARQRAGRLPAVARRCLGLATALLGDPPVLLLDAPGEGLDADGRRWLAGLLGSLAEQGRTLLVATRRMGELDGSADHLVVLDRGRLVADTSVQDLLRAAGRDRTALRTPRRAEIMTVLANAGATVAATGADALTVVGLDADRIAVLLSARDLPFSDLAVHRPALEEAYMEVTRMGPTETDTTAARS